MMISGAFSAIFDFNPLPPHGGRRRVGLQAVQKLVISIHSLRMEGDFLPDRQAQPGQHFNPLPPHGGRPILQRRICGGQTISIHSLRMEGDSGKCFT